MNRKTVYLSIDKALYEIIKQQSKKENRSVNNYIETILKQYSNASELHKVDIEIPDSNIEYVDPNQLKLEFE